MTGEQARARPRAASGAIGAGAGTGLSAEVCRGGPPAEPDDVRHLLKRTRGVAGSFGASAIERLPVETAISRTVRDFKNDHR